MSNKQSLEKEMATHLLQRVGNDSATFTFFTFTMSRVTDNFYSRLSFQLFFSAQPFFMIQVSHLYMTTGIATLIQWL